MVAASIAEPDPYSAEGSIEWLRNKTKGIAFCASHLERIRKELARRADAVESYQASNVYAEAETTKLQARVAELEARLIDNSVFYQR